MINRRLPRLDGAELALHHELDVARCSASSTRFSQVRRIGPRDRVPPPLSSLRGRTWQATCRSGAACGSPSTEGRAPVDSSACGRDGCSPSDPPRGELHTRLVRRRSAPRLLNGQLFSTREKQPTHATEVGDFGPDGPTEGRFAQDLVGQRLNFRNTDAAVDRTTSHFRRETVIHKSGKPRSWERYTRPYIMWRWQ